MRQWRSARRAAETKVLTVNALEVTGEMQSCTRLLKKTLSSRPSNNARVEIRGLFN